MNTTRNSAANAWKTALAAIKIFEVNDHPQSGWLDRYASLQAPPFKAGLREAIWIR
jgi:hypothetical protein